MRIRDLTENRTDEGPVWNKVKAGVKKIFAPGEKKHPLVTHSSDVRYIFQKIVDGKQLDNNDMLIVKDILRKI